MTEGLRNFAKRYNYAINDPELIRRYRMVEDGKRDIATKIAVAEKRGEQRGEQRGKDAMQREVVRRMKAEGMEPDLIARITGLSESEIHKL